MDAGDSPSDSGCRDQSDLHQRHPLSDVYLHCVSCIRCLIESLYQLSDAGISEMQRLLHPLRMQEMQERVYLSDSGCRILLHPIADAGDSLSDSGCRRLLRMQDPHQTADAGVSLSDSGCRSLLHPDSGCRRLSCIGCRRLSDQTAERVSIRRDAG